MRETEMEVAKVSDNPYLKHLYDHKLEAFKLGLVASVKTLNDTNKQYNLGLKDAVVPEHLRPGQQQQSQPVQAQHVMHNVIERWKQDPTKPMAQTWASELYRRSSVKTPERNSLPAGRSSDA